MLVNRHFISEADFNYDALAERGDATITVRHVRGRLQPKAGTANGGERIPAPDRLVVARVFTQRTNGGMVEGPILVEPVEPSGVDTLGAPLVATPLAVSEFWLKGRETGPSAVEMQDDMRPNYQVGRLLVARTDANGVARFAFDLGASALTLGSEDSIWFDVEAIVEVAPTYSLPPQETPPEDLIVNVPEFALAVGTKGTIMNEMAYAQWDFPNSTEARTTQHIIVP